MPAVTTEQVESRVIEALASFGPDPEQITRDATFEELDIDSLDLVERWRRQGLKIGFTNGCFDLLHPGQAAYAKWAAALRPVLETALARHAAFQTK